MASIKKYIYPFYLYFEQEKMIFDAIWTKAAMLTFVKCWEQERIYKYITFGQLKIKILMRHNLLSSF